jgi:hypothetical protein
MRPNRKSTYRTALNIQYNGLCVEGCSRPIAAWAQPMTELLRMPFKVPADAGSILPQWDQKLFAHHVQREKFVFLYEYIARRNGIIMYVRAFVPGTGLGRRLDAGGLTLGTGQHTWWSSVQRMDRFGLVCSNMILLCKWRPQL